MDEPKWTRRLVVAVGAIGALLTFDGIFLLASDLAIGLPPAFFLPAIVSLGVGLGLAAWSVLSWREIS